MKLDKPIDIDLKKFILDGDFDFIRLGQTKEWIINNFPNPDNDSNEDLNFSIWEYGSIEFHFDGDKLFLIWCDNLSHLDECITLKIDKWIFEDLSKLTLRNVLSILNTEQSNYSIKFNQQLHNTVVKIRKSGVTLWFENIENWEDSTRPDIYCLVGFGLNHPEYDTFERDF